MTAQEAIKKFMNSLDKQRYTGSNVSIKMLDDAVRSSSRFNGVQNLIDNFLADQKAAERAAIKEILGNDYKSDYDGLQLSDLLTLAETDTDLAAILETKATVQNYGTRTFTATERIRMAASKKFLEDYCGIVLNRNFYHLGTTTYYHSDSGNTDTGAISGADAGGSTIKTATSVVPEIGNKYTATTSAGQIINTGDNDWIVQATDSADEITSGGTDSINAGGGADVIYVNGNNATIHTGANDNAADSVRVNSAAKTVTIVDLEANDTLTIEGDFVIGNSELDSSSDSMTLTDKTGSRTIIIMGWTSAQNSTATIGNARKTFSEWIGSATTGNVAEENISEGSGDYSEIIIDADELRIAPDDEIFIDNETGNVSENSVEIENYSGTQRVSVNLSKVTDITGNFVVSGSSATANYKLDSDLVETDKRVGEVSSEFPNVTSFTTHGLTFELWGRASNKNPSDSTITKLSPTATSGSAAMTDGEKNILAAMYKWWIKEGLKLNEESYNLGFNTEGVTGTKIKFFFYTDTSSSTLAFVRNYGSGVGLEMAVNMKYYANITATDVNGGTSSMLDRTLAHELTHAIMAANLNNFNSLPQFVKEGLAELTHGIDDERGSRIWELGGAATDTSRLAAAVDLSNVSTGQNDCYAGGYMFFRYLAKQAAADTANLPALGDITAKVNLTGNDATYFISGNSVTETASTIDSGSNFSVGTAANYSYTPVVAMKQEIHTSNDSWKIAGLNNNNTLYAGAGSDSVTLNFDQNDYVDLGGGENVVSIVGGENNTIIGGAGNDVVTLNNNYIGSNFYASAKNLVQLGGGNDTIYTYGKNNTVSDRVGDNTANLFGANDTITFGGGNDSISIGSAYASLNVADAGEGENYFYLNGNDNTLISGSGNDIFTGFKNAQNHSNVVYAGGGADSIEIAGTNSTFYGGAGNDTIDFINYTTASINSANFVDAGEGDDKINVYSYNQTVLGGSGNDSVYLFSGASLNAISGGDGNDYFYISTANQNTLTSGSGTDTIRIENSSANITITDLDASDVIYLANRVINGTYDSSTKIITLGNAKISVPNVDKLYTYRNMKVYSGGWTTLGDVLNLQTETIKFAWTTGKYYFPLSNVAFPIVEGTRVYNDAEDTKYRTNATYFILDYNASSRYLSASAQYVDANGNFTNCDGNYSTGISIDAAENILNFSKNSGATYQLTFSNVGSGSTFRNLSAKDNVYAISENNFSVSVNGKTFSGANLNIYGGDTPSAYSGKFTVTDNLTAYNNGTKISYARGTTYNGAVVTVQNGAIYGVESLTGGESVTVAQGNNSTVFAANSAGDTITRTITERTFRADGTKQSETVTVAQATNFAAGGNIFSANYPTASHYVTNYNNSSVATSVNLYSGTFGNFTLQSSAGWSGITLLYNSAGNSIAGIDADNFTSGESFSVGNITYSVTSGKIVRSSDGKYYNGDWNNFVGNMSRAASWSEWTLTDYTFVWNVSGNTAAYYCVTTGENAFTLSVGSFASGVNLDEILEVSGDFGSGLSVKFKSGKAIEDLVGGDSDDTAVLSGATWGAAPSVSGAGNDAGWVISGTTATYFCAGVDAECVLSTDGKTLSYNAASDGALLCAVSGLKNNAPASGLSLDGTEITLANSVLNQGAVTVSSGYTLKLGSDVATPTTTAAAGWRISGTTATYKTATISAGYALENNSVAYQNASGGETLATISGLRNNAPVSGISLSGTEITLANSVLNKGAVTVSSGYTLKLADDVATPTTTAAGWNISGTTATYKAEYISAGYVLENNSVAYQNASGGETLVTISGLKFNAPISGISLSGTEITLAASVLNQGAVSVSSGYTLKLASDVVTPITTAGYWTISGTTATYKAGYISAGYVLENNAVTYQKASGGNNLVNVYGLKSNAAVSGISLSGTEITLSAEVLNQSAVSVSSSYTLKLAGDVATPTTTAAGWKISGTTATYSAEKISAGYVLENNSVAYQKASGGETLATVSGVKSLSGISIDGMEITLANSALNQGAVSVSSGYTLKLAEDVATPITTAAHWDISGTTATYSAEKISAGYVLENNSVAYQKESGGETLATVSGVKSLSGISLSGTEITLSAASLNQGAVSVSSGYTLKLADDVATPSTAEAAGWKISGTTATYSAEKISAGYVLENNSVAYQKESGGETLATVSGVKSLSGISLSGTEITLSAASLNQGAVTVSSGYTLKLAEDVETPTTTAAAGWKISGTTATYSAEKISAGYVLENNSVAYQKESGGETLATVSGVKSLDGISIDGTEITLAAASLNQSAVTISSGYTLKLADDVATPTTAEAAGWKISGTTATYSAEKISAGYVLENNSVAYQKESGGETLATVSGVKSLSGISLSGTEITLANSALNQSAVTVSSGYTLKLADDVETPTTTAAGWNISGTTATYSAEKISAGYVLENNSIRYQKESGGETLATVSGVKSLSGISLSGTEITLANSALNQSAVTVSSGYTLKLAEDVETPTTTAAAWNISGTTATYSAEKISAGYVLENNSVAYQKESGGETLATVSGVKSLSGISLSGTEITLSAASLNQGAVSVSSGYTLKLGSDVETPITTAAAGWKISGTTATYSAEKISAGYVLENNSVAYQKESGGETLATVSGVKSLSGISIDGTEITLANSALNQGAVTVSSGYTLKLGSDVETPVTTAAHWKISGTTATYSAEKISAGYVLENNSVRYQKESGGETLATVSGVKSLSGISLSGTEITLSAASLNQGAVTVSSGYTLKLAGDVETPTTTAAHWNLSGTTATYSAEKISAGYVLENNSVAYQKESGGETLATISGVKSLSGLSMDGNSVTLAASAVAPGSVSISDGYKLTLAQGSYSRVTLSGGDNADSFKNLGTALAINSNDGADFISNGGAKTTVNAGAGNDTVENSAANSKIFGGAGNDLISLGGNFSGDTIFGGAGNDTIYANSGRNIFGYADGDGADIIFGFKENDTLKLNAGSISGAQVSGDDVILEIGDGAVTLKDARDKKITVVDAKKKSSTQIYSAGMTFDANKTSATLSADFSGSLSAASTVTKIDASKVSSAIYLEGNTKANSIFGGSGNDTLSGGKGNDTLTGNSGADVYIYSAGKDVITDYAEGDRLQFSAAISSVSVKSSDVIFKVGSGSLTVKNGVDKKITATEGDKTSTQIYSNGATFDENRFSVTLASTFKGTLNAANYSALTNIDATAASNALKIFGASNPETISGGSKNDTIFGYDGNDLISGGTGNDTLYGGSGNDTLSGDKGNDVFVYEGGNDVITDYEIADKIRFSNSTLTSATVSGNDVIFSADGGSITLQGARDKKITVVDAKKKSSTQIYSAGMTFDANKTSATLSADFTGSLSAASTVTKIDASKVSSAIYLEGNAKANSIFGGSGNDTLFGGKGNDTLTGNSGADVYIYSAGKDVITDYAEGDRLQFSAAISSVSVKSSDVIFKVGSGSLTVKNGVDKKITTTEGDKTSTQIYSNGATFDENRFSVTLASTFKGTLNAANYADLTTIEGTAAKSNLKILGNSNAETILGGTKNDSILGNAGNDLISGGAGNDTLYGGAGNDTLTGDLGNDVFVYESGNDVITDYAAGKDKIKLASGTISGASVSGKDVILEIGGETLTVKDAAGQKITFLDSKNKSTTQIFEDDNFISNDTNLASISEISADYSATNLETPSAENVAQISIAAYNSFRSK